MTQKTKSFIENIDAIYYCSELLNTLNQNTS